MKTVKFCERCNEAGHSIEEHFDPYQFKRNDLSILLDTLKTEKVAKYGRN
jgi:hypothetical protein